ncbi:phosphotransferase family protein [Williamsia deligens]|uniref:Phosphotransferase family protein n=1 Tax=Williamsia deligens TaxID=321325 RepID=A0ABW3G740_9NOCA|nr:putative kinase, aminoglycoside phosphotransferase (APT) family [Williamsia deligens]
MVDRAPIPEGIDDVTPTWLGQVQSRPDRPVVVESVGSAVVGTGQTGSTYRLEVTYPDGADHGLPATFAVKLPSVDPDVRDRVALGYRSEHTFYTRVADTVAVPVPTCHHIDIAGDGAEFVLLMDDLAPAEQGDQIAGCSRDEAVAAARALAGLHGPRWCDPAWLSLPGIVLGRPDRDGAQGLGEIAGIAIDTTIERLGDRLRADDVATLRAVAPHIAPWLMAEHDRFSVLHGDYRLDNLMFSPDRTSVTVVDWQTLAVGLPARDLAYLVATSVEPDRRSTIEDDAVAAYHDGLLEHGVTGHDLAQCRRDHRLAMLQVPLITTLGFAFSAATDRGDEMAAVMLTRGCAAIRDLDTLSLVEEYV